MMKKIKAGGKGLSLLTLKPKHVFLCFLALREEPQQNQPHQLAGHLANIEPQEIS